MATLSPICNKFSKKFLFVGHACCWNVHAETRCLQEAKCLLGCVTYVCIHVGIAGVSVATVDPDNENVRQVTSSVDS